jgi:CRISPR/Cas system-associated endoribonuclease Cas2
MNLAVGKLGAKGLARVQQSSSAGKIGPSKFDALRADLNKQLSKPLNIPPLVTRISEQQRTVLENDLRRRLDGAGATQPRDFFKVDFKNAKTQVQNLNRAAAGLPKSDALAPLRDRVKAIEEQFEASGKLLKGLDSIDNPEELLRVQVQLYQVTQNVELMSKVVDQVSSGIKTVLQTPV